MISNDKRYSDVIAAGNFFEGTWVVDGKCKPHYFKDDASRLEYLERTQWSKKKLERLRNATQLEKDFSEDDFTQALHKAPASDFRVAVQEYLRIFERDKEHILQDNMNKNIDSPLNHILFASSLKKAQNNKLLIKQLNLLNLHLLRYTCCMNL